MSISLRSLAHPLALEPYKIISVAPNCLLNLATSAITSSTFKLSPSSIINLLIRILSYTIITLKKQQKNVKSVSKILIMQKSYVIMKHAKEKGATAKQAFPFRACFNEQMFLRSRKGSSERADLRVCLRQKKRERLRSRHFLFMHVSTSKQFCGAERRALKERICESVQCKRKGGFL